MLRWLLRILIVIVALLVLAVAVTQAVLWWTDIPHRIVVGAMEQELGMRVTAGRVSPGWFGRTELRDVTLSLPLAGDAFLRVPRLRAGHATLPRLIVGRPLNLQALEFHRPYLVVRQDETGHWNIQEVFELLLRATTAEPDDPPGRPSVIALPRLLIRDGVIHLIDNVGREAMIEPVLVQGRPDGRLQWRYDGTVANQLDVTGQLVPGWGWRHQVTFAAARLEPLLEMWMPQAPHPLIVQGEWEGEMTRQGLRGLLQVNHLQAGDLTGRGMVRVHEGQNRTYHLQPERWMVGLPGEVIADVQLVSGQLSVDDRGLHAQRLQLLVADGQARIDGSYRWSDGAAALEASWRDLALRADVTASGDLTASLQTPLPGRPRLRAELASHGTSNFGDWEAQLNLDGDGTAWDEMDWRVDFPRMAFRFGRDTFAVHGLAAALRTRGAMITLDELELGRGGQISGQGWLNLEEMTWQLWVHGRDWPVHPLEDATAEMVLETRGTPDQIELHRLYLRSGEFELGAEGSYVYQRPQPVDLQAYLQHHPSLRPDEDQGIIGGRLRADARLVGTAAPLDLTMQGNLFGDDLHVMDRDFGNIVLALRGQIDPEQIRMETTELLLLDGRWRFHGFYSIREPQPLRITLAVEELSLAEVAELAGFDQAQGVLNGRWEFEVLGMGIENLIMRGAFNAGDVVVSLQPEEDGEAIGAVDEQPETEALIFAAESVQGQMTLSDGILHISPIVAQQERGIAELELALDARTPQQVRLEMAMEHWPLRLPEGVDVEFGGDSRLQLNFADRTATGPLRVNASVFRGAQPILDATMDAEMSERVLLLHSLQAVSFDGQAEGLGAIDLNDPLRTRLSLRYWDLDAAYLAGYLRPGLQVEGLISGTLTVAPADDPRRALGPLQMNLSLRATGGRFRAMTVDSAELLAFLDVNRFVLARSPIELADGMLHVWGRSSRHNDQWFHTQLNIELDRLDLNQLVQSANPEADSMPGRLSGSMTAVGHPDHPEQVFGGGTLRLTESDLVNFTPAAVLYGTLGVRTDTRELTGVGTLDVRLEAGALLFTQVSYFNRGLEARAQGRIHNIALGLESPVSGSAVGSMRPLAGLRLPFLADVDQITQVLQRDAATIVIEGTVGDVRARVVPFAEMGETLRRFLGAGGG